MTTGLDCSHGVNTLLSLARALLSTLAAIWLLGVQSAGAASFTSTQAGAYSDTATWGGGAEPSNGGVPAADTVSIGHAVHILNANDPNSDALTLTAGGSLESRGVSPAASSLDLSAGDGSLLSGNAAAANGATRTITLNAGSGARLTLGGGRTTTVGVGANVNVNSTYGVTLQTSSATTTGLNGTHTFNVNNNGTSLGTLTLSQAIVGTASTPDTIVKQGAGLLMLTVRPTFNASDEDRINMEGGRVGIGSAPSNMRVNFLTAGVVLNSSAVAWPSSTTLDFQQSATLYGGNTPTGDADPTWNSIFTGSGTITFDRGQFRHNLAANASSSWSGVMIAGTGGRGSVDVNNANLTPTLLTVYGATGFTSPDIASDSSNSGFLRLNTPSWTVGGLNTAGNGVNTRIGSKTSGNTRTLTINVGDALSYTYNGILANGITGDTSVLALIKSGNGAQTLSGQTYLSSYSGGTEVNGGTLIVNGGGTAVQKTSATALSSLANNNTSADVNVGATSDLYIGKRLTAIAGSAVANNVFISSITDATKIKITNRSGSALAAIAIGNTLDFEASSPTGSGNVTVNNAATLAGSGRIAGAVTLNNTTTLAPGDGGVGTLAIGGGLTMGGSVTSVFERTSAAVGDTVVVTGDLNLNGTINIASVGVLQGGDHVLMTCTGTLTGNGAVLGTTPPNTVCNLVVAGTTVKVTITLSGPEINVQGNGQNIPSGSTPPLGGGRD